MIVVACSGFPVPVSRYWAQFPGVEISDTELGMPGEGTVRRWVRESPKGFCFTILAPKTIGESGFAKSKENKDAMQGVADIAQKLSARGVVLGAPEDFKHTKTTRAAVNGLVKTLPAKLPHLVLDFPAWKPEQVLAAVDKPVVAAFDPLRDKAPKGDGGLLYLRLPGPAGHRSRYDDASLEQIRDACRAVEKSASLVFCVFRNIDMQANGQSLLKLLG